MGGLGVARCFRLWLWSHPLSSCPRKGSSEARCSLRRVLLEMPAFCSCLACIFFPLSLKKGLWGRGAGHRSLRAASRPSAGAARGGAAGAARRGRLGAGPDRAGPGLGRRARSGPAAGRSAGCAIRLWGGPAGSWMSVPPFSDRSSEPSPHYWGGEGKAAVFWNGLSLPLECPKGVNFELERRLGLF